MKAIYAAMRLVGAVLVMAAAVAINPWLGALIWGAALCALGIWGETR